MSVKLDPTVSRGTAALLQPFYYTSSLFVEPMREDISSLLSAFATAYAAEPLEPEKPFQLFKNIWQAEGWEIIHLRALDSRARVVFLRTVIRLFVERLDPVEYPLIRVGALFGLYTFYMIQPDATSAIIQVQQHITLSIDVYEQLMSFPATLQSSLRAYTAYILSQFLSLNVLHIGPHSTLEAQNPRILPHTTPLLTRDIDHSSKKKAGRPSQLEQSRRADDALSALERFVDQVGDQATGELQRSTTPLSSVPERPSPDEYLHLKGQLRGVVPEDAVKTAEALTMERMQDVKRRAVEHNLPVGDQYGLERVKSAASHPEGLLGLVSKKKVDDT